MNLFCIVVYCISFFIALYFISTVPYLVYLRLVNCNSPSHIFYSIIMICRCHVVVKYSSMSQEKIFWAMSWISFKIHLSYLKFDGDHESVSYFHHNSIVEELSVYFRCTSDQN